MKMSRHNFARAFTLIELVLAMAMVAILAASLAETLHIAFKATASAKADLEPGSTADLALDLVHADMQNAMQSSGQLVQSFEGTQAQDERGHEADDVVFYGTTDSPQHVAANGEVKQIEIKTVESPSGDHVLVRRVIRNLLYPDTLPNPDEDILCRGVDSFTLEYFDGSNWDTTWDSTQNDNTVPVAVRVTLVLDRPDAQGKIHTYTFMRAFPLTMSTLMQNSTDL